MYLCGLQPPRLCHSVVLQELTDISEGHTASTFRTEAENRRWKQQVPPTLLPNYMVLHPRRQEYSYSLPQKPQTSLVLISHLSLIILFNLLCIWGLQIILISMMYKTILSCTTADTNYSFT